MIDDELQRMSIMVERSTWRKAQNKAGLTPMSALIRRLLKLYVKGDIELEEKGGLIIPEH